MLKFCSGGLAEYGLWLVREVGSDPATLAFDRGLSCVGYVKLGRSFPALTTDRPHPCLPAKGSSKWRDACLEGVCAFP